MRVFISHSFDDRDQFDNLADAFDSASIEYWRPGDMMPGANLSEQLREAILKSEVCVFVATNHSVNSAWCGAELGAFWGAGKKVFIFIADTSLTQEQLPRQFQGHFTERRISKLVHAVNSYFEESKTRSLNDSRTTQKDSGITKDEFNELIEAALVRVQKGLLTSTVFRQIGEFLLNSSAREMSISSIDSLNDSERKALHSIMDNLIGLSQGSIENAASLEWPNRVSFSTTSGYWTGYAKKESLQSYNYIYYPCLMFRYNDKKIVIAACILPAMAELDRGGVSVNRPVIIVGDNAFGELIKDG
jgi:hypothetical protein